MADTLHVQMWLVDENFERRSPVRTETVGYTIERRHVTEASPVCAQSWEEKVTRLWALEEIPFAVPAGARVAHVVVKVGAFETPAKLECGVTDFPSDGTFNVWPLEMEVREKLND